MMYAVVSFDFLGSSNVAVHALLTDEARARQVFQRVCDAAQRLKQPNKPLVDLLRVDGDELESDEGVLLFWGDEQQGSATRLASNN